MIICGYQGIGKSTLAKTTMIDDEIPVLDLESGNFWVDGKRCNHWYKIYAQIAVHLSQQGNIVMMSSHKVVRDYLKEIHENERLATIYPSDKLKERWTQKLRDRYFLSKKDKDYKALKNAEEMYSYNINELATQEGFDHICITNIDYHLDAIVRMYVNMTQNLPSKTDPSYTDNMHGRKILYLPDAVITLKENK